MPLLFLEKDGGKMVTLAEIKGQVDTLKGQLAIFDRFDEEIQKAKDDIQAIKNKGGEVQTFEDFQAINAKQKYLSELISQRKNMEVSKIGEIVDGVRKIKVSTYLSESLEQDETVKHQRQEIKQKSIELLELIANYNDTYKNTAKKLVDGVEKTGINDVYDRINESEEYNRLNPAHIYSPTSGYNGDSSRYLDSTDTLGYLINRIKYFEGE